jgi:hypothetical protein
MIIMRACSIFLASFLRKIVMHVSTVASERILTPPSEWMPPSIVSSKKIYLLLHRILFYSANILLPFTMVTSEKLLLYLGPFIMKNATALSYEKYTFSTIFRLF